MGGIAAVAFTQQQNYMVEGQKKLAAHRNADEKHQRKRRGHPGTDGHQPGTTTDMVVMLLPSTVWSSTTVSRTTAA